MKYSDSDATITPEFAMKIPPKKKAPTEFDIEEFGEWLQDEAEARGFALIAFIGKSAPSGAEEIDFQKFQTSLSLKNIEKLEKEATDRANKEILENIMEKVKSALDIYNNGPLAILLEM